MKNKDKAAKFNFLRKQFFSREEGMNLPEVSITLAVIGVFATLSAPAFTMQGNALNDTMNLVEGNFKVARSKAMSQTTAYRIKPDGSDRFIMQKHASGVGSSVYGCKDSDLESDGGSNVWTQAQGFNVEEDMALQDGVQIKSVSIDGAELSDISDWELCFDARGMANKNVILTLEETSTGSTKTLEVLSGGSLVSYDSARFRQGASSPSGMTSNNSDGNADNSAEEKAKAEAKAATIAMLEKEVEEKTTEAQESREKAEKAEQAEKDAEQEADKAEKEAKEAEKEAEEAEKEAEEAEEEAKEAEEEADKAKKDKKAKKEKKEKKAKEAKEARGKADLARGKANQARGKADLTRGKADLARGKADEAKGKADLAREEATKLENEANIANYKLQCNKGGGNGAEGCDPGNNPDNGNNDELPV